MDQLRRLLAPSWCSHLLRLLPDGAKPLAHELFAFIVKPRQTSLLAQVSELQDFPRNRDSSWTSRQVKHCRSFLGVPKMSEKFHLCLTYCSHGGSWLVRSWRRTQGFCSKLTFGLTSLPFVIGSNYSWEHLSTSSITHILYFAKVFQTYCVF